MLEAQASSEIGNIVTTTDRLFQFRELHAQADAATKEALRYSGALLEGYQAVQKRPVTTRPQVVGREKLFIHPKLMRLLTTERNTVEPYT